MRSKCTLDYIKCLYIEIITQHTYREEKEFGIFSPVDWLSPSLSLPPSSLHNNPSPFATPIFPVTLVHRQLHHPPQSVLSLSQLSRDFESPKISTFLQTLGPILNSGTPPSITNGFRFVERSSLFSDQALPTSLAISIR